MPGWVSDAVLGCPLVRKVDVSLVWEPQWGMDMMSDDEPQEEAVEYDLDESDVEEDEVVEEATKLQDKVAEPKGGEADNNDSGNAKFRR